MGNFRPDHKKALDDLLLEDPRVKSGQMFGYPAYYTGKKAFLCIYQNGMSLKVPEKTVKHLLETDPNTSPFQPMQGRIMREWILVSLERPEDYQKYLPLMKESIQFVISGQENG